MEPEILPSPKFEENIILPHSPISIDPYGQHYLIIDNQGKLTREKYDEEKNEYDHMKIKIDGKIINAYSGGDGRLSTAVTESGSLYIWGRFIDKENQIIVGIEPPSKFSSKSSKILKVIPSELYLMILYEDNSLHILEPSLIFQTFYLKYKDGFKGIADISSKDYYDDSYVASTTDNKVIYWGGDHLIGLMPDNRFSHATTTFIGKYISTENPEFTTTPEPIVRVCFSINYIMGLSKSGNLYLFQKFGYTPKDEPNIKTIAVDLPEKIVFITSYGRSLAAVTITGRLFMRGVIPQPLIKFAKNSSAIYWGKSGEFLEIDIGQSIRYIDLKTLLTIIVTLSGKVLIYRDPELDKKN